MISSGTPTGTPGLASQPYIGPAANMTRESYMNPNPRPAFFRSLKRWSGLALLENLIRGRNPAAFYRYVGGDIVEPGRETRDIDQPLWLNFGYWKDADTYAGACADLALLLSATAGLDKGDSVLDVGFGFGDQDLLWMDTHGVSRIDGLNISPLHVSHAREKARRKGFGDRIVYHLGSATRIPFPDESFDKVLALECGFHFLSRERFFSEAFRVLRPGGRLAMTDLIPLPGEDFSGLRNWYRRGRLSIPSVNLYDRFAFAGKLHKIGFRHVQVRSIRDNVFPGILKYYSERHRGLEPEQIRIRLSKREVTECPGAGVWEDLGGLSDYVLVRADKPDPS